MALWTPADTTTALWLDGADSSTVTLVSGAVSQLNDKSGNARNATQGSASKRATVSTAAINGRDAIVFDAVDDGMITSYNFQQANSWSIYLVARQGSGGRRAVQSSGKNALFSVYRAASNVVFVTSAIRFANWESPNAVGMGVLSAPSSGNFVFHGNGTDLTDRAKAVESWGGNVCLGAEGLFSGEVFDGTFCELIIVATSQTTAQRQQFEGYLMWKWGIQSKLPVGHLYKNGPPTKGGNISAVHFFTFGI